MIKYRLACADGHSFESWFSSVGSFEAQQSRGLVTCAVCGGTRVDRALMAPAIARRDREPSRPMPPDVPSPAAPAGDTVMMPAQAPTAPAPPAAGEPSVAQLVEVVRQIKRRLIAEATDVGPAFPEEARKIHYGEAEPRGIYGKADPEQASALIEEGISILPLPDLPEEQN